MLGKLLFFASPLLRFLGGCDACQGQDTGGCGERVSCFHPQQSMYGTSPMWVLNSKQGPPAKQSRESE